MDKLNLNTHISSKFNEELDLVRKEVLTMGGLVEQQLKDALSAAVHLDEAMAQQVIESDHLINQIELKIDEDCTRIIAKRQPTAGDLRLMLVIMKAIADLERIGDEAVRIAKVAHDALNNKQQNALLHHLNHLGESVQGMLQQTLNVFARIDDQEARRVYSLDKPIDREYETLIRLLITYMMEDPRSIPKVMSVIWAVRSLERIGDRCQNICEYVVYLVQGEDVRHSGRMDLDMNA